MPSTQSSPQQLKLFCSDNSLLQTDSIIFDNTYKNISQKNKLEHNQKFAYFNTLTKIKNNYLHTNKRIYQHIFNQSSNQNLQNLTNFNKTNKRTKSQYFTYSPKQTFYVQKINNHSFKIYKNSKNQHLSQNNTKYNKNYHTINDINFQIRNQLKNTTMQPKNKQKIQLLYSEYKKLKDLKFRINSQKNTKIKLNKLYFKQVMQKYRERKNGKIKDVCQSLSISSTYRYIKNQSNYINR